MTNESEPTARWLRVTAAACERCGDIPEDELPGPFPAEFFRDGAFIHCDKCMKNDKAHAQVRFATEPMNEPTARRDAAKVLMNIEIDADFREWLGKFCGEIGMPMDKALCTLAMIGMEHLRDCKRVRETPEAYKAMIHD